MIRLKLAELSVTEGAIIDVVQVNNDRMVIESFNHGIVAVKVGNSEILDVPKVLAGCLEPSSDLARILIRLFPEKEEKIKGIKVQLPEANFLVGINETLDEISNKWEKAKQASNRKQKRIEQDLEKAMEIISTITFASKTENVQQVNMADSPIFKEYVYDWAKLMQYLVEKYKKPVADVAQMAANAIDEVKATQFRNAAVAFLKKHWKYGDALKEWYKCQLISEYLIRKRQKRS